MSRLKQKIALLLIVVLMTVTMTGCFPLLNLIPILIGPKDDSTSEERTQTSQNIEERMDTHSTSQNSNYGYNNDYNSNYNNNSYYNDYSRGYYREQGSALYLEGKTVIVAIYVSEDGDVFTDKEVNTTIKHMDIAANWLQDQGRKYGKKVELIMPNNSRPDLSYEMQSSELIKLSKANDYKAYMYKSGDLVTSINKEEIKRKYNTDSIGYIIFLKESGISFTHSYSPSYGSNYNEVATMYLYDSYNLIKTFETPATYAHEILHLFGAIDLYKANPYEHVSQTLVDYVKENHPDEIMFTVYQPDGIPRFNSINHEITDITAYMVGFKDDIPELRQFPELRRIHKAAFD